MQIDVNDILRQGDGHQADFEISEERPELEDIKLASPISGSIKLMAMNDGVLASGHLEADIEMECTRCLRTFSNPMEFPLDAEFMEHPGEDQYPVDKNGQIDLAEPIRQEIEIHLPLAPLCQADCVGIE